MGRDIWLVYKKFFGEIETDVVINIADDGNHRRIYTSDDKYQNQWTIIDEYLKECDKKN